MAMQQRPPPIVATVKPPPVVKVKLQGMGVTLGVPWVQPGPDVPWDYTCPHKKCQGKVFVGRACFNKHMKGHTPLPPSQACLGCGYNPSRVTSLRNHCAATKCGPHQRGGIQGIQLTSPSIKYTGGIQQVYSAIH